MSPWKDIKKTPLNEWISTTMKSFISVPEAQSGDRVAVVSPAFAAPAIGPEIHDQAMRRLQDSTGLIPIEFPTTRQLGASAEARVKISLQRLLIPVFELSLQHLAATTR